MEEKKFTIEEAMAIGNELGIDWALIQPEEFLLDLQIEMVHGLRDPCTNVTGDSTLLIGKIAWAHLNEFSAYYTRLIKCLS